MKIINFLCIIVLLGGCHSFVYDPTAAPAKVYTRGEPHIIEPMERAVDGSFYTMIPRGLDQNERSHNCRNRENNGDRELPQLQELEKEIKETFPNCELPLLPQAIRGNDR